LFCFFNTSALAALRRAVPGQCSYAAHAHAAHALSANRLFFWQRMPKKKRLYEHAALSANSLFFFLEDMC
jgi:membrane-associated PAP2 superfamily phosphatase